MSRPRRLVSPEDIPPCSFLADYAPCRYPDDEPPWPGCEAVKRLAAKVGRARTPEGERKAEARLIEELDLLDAEALELWAGAVMIDRRFQGATGAGGFWAKASEAVNTIASNLLAERRAMDALRRRVDSPMTDAEALRLRDDVLKGRGLASVCGDHRATIGEVLEMRRAVAWRTPA